MLSVLKTSLIFAIACSVPSAFAQPQGRNKPAPKTVEVEVKDPLKQAAALFDAGQNAHQRGDLENAIDYYNEALKRDPSLWQAEFQASAAYFSLSRYTEARKSITHVIEQLKEFADSTESRQISARAQTVLGEIALAESKHEEAEKAFRRAIELHPPSARAHAGLAEVLLEAGKSAEAINEAKAAMEAGDDRVSTLALLGEALTLARRYDESLPVLEEVLKREPRNAVVLQYRAEVFVSRNNLSAAIADLRAALASEPIIAAKRRLAELLTRAKQYDEAIALYQQIVKDEPANTEAKIALAALMIDSGKGADAIAQLESLVKADPNRAALRAQLAELYLLAQPEKALDEYTAAARLEPSQPSHKIGVGSALVKLRRFPEAVAALRQALDQNPNDAIAYFAHTNLATALFEQDDFPNAAREFLWILNHQQDKKRAAITLFFLGICFDKLGDYEQALKAYEQFLSLASPENQLEIDKVKLRLPPLKNQIEKGKGKRKR